MKLNKYGFFQALGIAAYCTLVGLFILNANSIFGKMNTFLGPTLFLLLFATSALICGAIVLYKPYQFFIKDKKKEALNTIISTIVWLFAFLIVYFSLMFIFK